MMRGRLVAGAAVGACLLILACSWAPCAAADAPSRSVLVSTGQELADAIAEWGAEGGNVEIVLRANVSLDNVTLPSAPSGPDPLSGRFAFSSGNLTIRGDSTACPPGTPAPCRPILDARMRPGLTPTLTGSTELVLDGITLINLCEQQVVQQIGVITVSTFGLFSLLNTLQNRVMQEMTIYARQSETVQLLYVATTQSSPFNAVRRFLAAALADMPYLEIAVRSFDAHTLNLGTAKPPTEVMRDIAMKSYASTEDPLLTELRQLGSLMAAQFCNGTAVPPPLLSWPGSVLPAANVTQLAMALQAALVVLSNPLTPTIAIPVVAVQGRMALNSASLAGPVSVPEGRAILLSGLPATQEPPPLFPATLDLLGRQGLFVVPPTAQLLVQHVTLTGLAAQPLTGDPSGPASVLPLSAISSGWQAANWSDPELPVQLHRVTLVVPAVDFHALALLAAVSSGVLRARNTGLCGSADAVLQATALQPGLTFMQQFVLPGSTDGQLHLRWLRGWGVNGSYVRVTTGQPGEDAAHLAALSACAATACSDCGGTDVGLIVGCSIGGAVALLLLCAAGVFVWRRRLGVGLSMQPTVHTPSSGSTCANGDVKLKVGLEPPVAVASDVSLNVGQAGPQARSSAQILSLKELVHAGELHHDEIYAARELRAGSGSGSSGSRGHSGGGGASTLQPATSDGDGDAMSVVVRTSAASPAVLDPGHNDGTSQARPPTGSRAFPGQGVRPRVKSMNRNPDDGDKVVIRALLGQGACGIVYLGEWRSLPVAVKTTVFEAHKPLPTAAGSGGGGGGGGVLGQMQAIMEAAITVSLNHRNVVATYTYDIKPMGAQAGNTAPGGLVIAEEFGDGTPNLQPVPSHTAPRGSPSQVYKVFLVQELCASSLDDALRHSVLHDDLTGAVVEESVMALLLDVARGLAYLHDHGIIHADLKPGNVLLKSDATSRVAVVAKLADFGLSVHLAADNTHVSNHRSGTPFYVAPEVIKQFRTSAAADMFSFGVLMWQLYSGLDPYVPGPDDGSALVWNPVFPRFTEPNLPPSQYLFLTNKCLQHDPRARPTAAMVVPIMERMLADAVRGNQ